jgi:cytoskeletal protein CcmA (bactofilin family)
MDQERRKDGADTVLGDDTVFVGKVQSRGTLRVDGRVEGEIAAEESVIVGPSGVVKANINAGSVSISGEVNGNIAARQKIELLPTAVVKGDIVTAVGALVIQAGARLDGACSMSSDKPVAQAAKPAGPEPPKAAPAPKPAGAPGPGPARP